VTVSEKNCIPKWRFLLPLGVQMLMILALPAQAIYTYYTGKTVILQTMPVDPYDLLRGYSQTLSYDISSLEDLKRLPGGDAFDADKSNSPTGIKLYVILEAPQVSLSLDKQPQAWKAVAVSRDRPANLPSNRIALKGISKYGRIEYGLETYYLPEAKIKDINQEINLLPRNPPNSPATRQFVVEIKVDERGNSVPVSLWIGDRNYRF
jgi:uncharacterized membrane-anchored protein